LGKRGVAESEDEGAGLFITTAGDLFQAPREDGRLSGSTDDNFGPWDGPRIILCLKLLRKNVPSIIINCTRPPLASRALTK
jgi:hypothetical protein